LFDLRKETSAGLIAGAVAALPVGLILAAVMIWFILTVLPAQFKSNPVMTSHTMILLMSGVALLMYVPLAACVGAIAGLIFTLATNKLPIRSTYVKALIPLAALWALYLLWTLYVLAFTRPPVGRLYVLNYLLIPSIEGAGVLAFGVLLFAYLFTRWTKSVGRFCTQCGEVVSSSSNKFCAKCGNAL
jgi:hypothetical protein